MEASSPHKKRPQDVCPGLWNSGKIKIKKQIDFFLFLAVDWFNFHQLCGVASFPRRLPPTRQRL